MKLYIDDISAFCIIMILVGLTLQSISPLHIGVIVYPLCAIYTMKWQIGWRRFKEKPIKPVHKSVSYIG